MSNLSINIKRTGKDPQQWLENVDRKFHFELQSILVDLAEIAAKNMQDNIIESGYKLDKLAYSIDSKIIDSTGGISIGIGEIAKLPFYYEMFNDGFKPGASMSFVPLGSFPDGAPDSKKHGGKWNVGDGNFTFFDKNTNKKSVPPIRYIQISFDELKANIKKQINKFSKELES